MLAVEPPRFPWRDVVDSVIELGAIIGAVALTQLLCWGMWYAR
jgi:hypothetical protein